VNRLVLPLVLASSFEASSDDLALRYGAIDGVTLCRADHLMKQSQQLNTAKRASHRSPPYVYGSNPPFKIYSNNREMQNNAEDFPVNHVGFSCGDSKLCSMRSFHVSFQTLVLTNAGADLLPCCAGLIRIMLGQAPRCGSSKRAAIRTSPWNRKNSNVPAIILRQISHEKISGMARQVMLLLRAPGRFCCFRGPQGCA
jgi:hypothetical protein